MFRICKIASLVTKTIRPEFITQSSNHNSWQKFATTQRFYSKSKDTKDVDPFRKGKDKKKEVHKPKSYPECKPVDIYPCSPPPPVCKQHIPPLQDCPKPNLMSQCPQPECPWEEGYKSNRKKYIAVLLLGILFAIATVGVLINKTDFNEKPVTKKEERKKGKKRIIKKIPSASKDIPDSVPYLLIGGGTASFSAFRAIKSADPQAKVLVITNEEKFPYMRPPLSKEMWFNEDAESVRKLIFKQWNGSERSLFYEPDDFYTKCKELKATENGGVSVARGWNVSHIDVVEKIAYLEDGYQINYDKCLIATGALPKNLDIFESASADSDVDEKVTLYRNIADFEELHEVVNEVKSVTIVGGGFLGSELACALARRGKKKKKQVCQIFREGGNMGKILPEYLSYWTTEKVKSEGVEIISNAEVVGVKAIDKNKICLTLSNGKTVYTDHVIVAVGAEANTELAEKSNLEVDPELGGYLVNTELQARSHLYIAGDCACFYDTKLGRRRVEHHDHAVVSGRLAGENMTGSSKPYLHQSMFWSDLGPDVGYEAIGIVDSTLPTVGVFAKATDKDNPKAVVTATDEGIRSKTEEIPPECKQYANEATLKSEQNSRKAASAPREGEDFGKGVIFYLRDDIVVGIVLWNVFNRMSIARQVLKDERKYEDLNEVAKLFNIHEE